MREPRSASTKNAGQTTSRRRIPFTDKVEISPKEFAQFIGKEMVLAHGHRVESAPRAESTPISNFYRGKNTPERKDYIMDKLVVPVEE